MNTKKKLSSLLIAMSVVASGYAQQDWTTICIDPENTEPRSTPYIVQAVQNSLIRCVMGVNGTVTYGGDAGPCFAPAETINIAGRFALSAGPVGSIHRPSPNFVDDNMGYTFGALSDPVWCYAAVSVDGTRTRYGSGGMGTAFVGFSNRYMIGEATQGGVVTRLQVEVVADAIRFRWRITNSDAQNPHNVGIWFGASPAMFLTSGGSSSTGDIVSGFDGGKPSYIKPSSGRPPVTQRNYIRAEDPIGFPKYVDFMFGQTDYFGFRIENEPSEATFDENPANNPATANEFWLGGANGILGAPSDNDANFPNGITPDTGFLNNPGFSQGFPEVSVPAAGTIDLVHYVRSNFSSAANYALPYGASVDAPRVIAASTAGGSLNGLTPNPIPIRVYVDNVGGYAFDGKEFPLNDVRIKLIFPTNLGVTIQGAPASKPTERELSIAVVQPHQLSSVDFQAVLDETAVGTIPYTVEIYSQPGNVKKIMKGEIYVASKAQIQLYPDANMISLPHNFTNSSLDVIFAPFKDPNVPGGDLQFYQYRPGQQGYVIVNSAPRGEGFWAIYKKTGSSPVLAPYGGNPTTGGGFLNQAPLIQTKSGFNMIANPYNYRIPINQIIGVSASGPQVARTMAEMVSLGYVQSFLTTWNPVTKDYEFVDTDNGYLEPHRAYWLNVLTLDDLTLNYPPVFTEGIPNMTRKPVNVWPQTPEKWRLRLSARTRNGADSENYIAKVSSSDAVKQARVNEPPMAPEPYQLVSLAIEEVIDGQTRKMAQSAQAGTGRKEYNVVVTAKEAGDVTINWPNLATLPKNVRLKLIDPATNITRSLRQTSGYTFKMEEPGTRNLKIVVEEGAADSLVIGNVVVTAPGRGTNAPVTINYTLGGDATTTVRILSATGQEVYTVTRGRADKAGSNTVTWNLRNSANRAVAPGTYKIEILAESESGERTRKVAVVNVVR